MSKIDSIIFDLGNVLLFFDWNATTEKMCARTGKTRRELMDYIFATPYVNQFELGQIDGKHFFEVVSNDLSLSVSREEFDLIWSDIFTPNEPMIALARALKGKTRRFILSNTIPPHIEFVRARFPFFSEFDGYVFSYEAGLMKPDRKIYDHAVQKFGVEAERTVFIDDLAGNVEAARSVGLNGIHHVSNHQTRQELTNLGITTI
jgi:epoxide hydrolase-like predicted phosphatase